MKKLISLTLAILLLAASCIGCGSANNGANNANATDSTDAAGSENPSDASDASGANDSNLIAGITGIDPGQIVANAGGVEVPAEIYFYWLNYSCTTLESQILMYSAYGMYQELLDESGAVNWDAPLTGTETVAQFAKMQTDATVSFYASIEALADEHGITLTNDALAAIEAELASMKEQLGGEEAFQEYLHSVGLTEEGLTHITSISSLYDCLLTEITTEGSALYLPLAAYDQYATYADHILLATLDLSTGSSYTEDQIAEKRATAEDLLAQLRAADDPEALFAQLADEYSEDTGRTTNPTGYVYTPGTMVTAFEDAASALEPGQISDIVESEYGFHIILRRDLAEALAADEAQLTALADTYLSDQLLSARMQEAPLELDTALDTLDAGAFYKSYVAARDALSAEAESEETGESTEGQAG